MPDADVHALLELLPGGDYQNDSDRYQDFRQLFMGSDQGKRVLYEILSWGKLFRPGVMGSPIDPYALAIAEGKRHLTLQLLSIVNIEPPTQPTKTRAKK